MWQRKKCTTQLKTPVEKILFLKPAFFTSFKTTLIFNQIPIYSANYPSVQLHLPTLLNIFYSIVKLIWKLEISPAADFLLQWLPFASTEHNLISNNIYQDSRMLNTINAFARPFNQAHQVTQHCSNCHVPSPSFCSGLNQQHSYIEVD